MLLKKKKNKIKLFFEKYYLKIKTYRFIFKMLSLNIALKFSQINVFESMVLNLYRYLPTPQYFIIMCKLCHRYCVHSRMECTKHGVTI